MTKGIFAGASYEPSADRARLLTQVERIRLYMLGVEWRTLAEIERDLETLWPGAHWGQASISAQLRNLKKKPYRCELEKRRRGNASRGLWEYRLLPAPALESREPQEELFRMDTPA